MLSPLLGNVYLHYVLDLWFEREVKPRLQGKAHLMRYADDFVIAIRTAGRRGAGDGGAAQADGEYGLTLHPDKTRLLPFRRPPRSQGAGRAGHLRLSWLHALLAANSSGSMGRWLARRGSARLHGRFRSVYDWCRRHRHEPVKVQHAALVRRIRGHFNYFGVNGNVRSLSSRDYSSGGNAGGRAATGAVFPIVPVPVPVPVPGPVPGFSDWGPRNGRLRAGLRPSGGGIEGEGNVGDSAEGLRR